MRSITLGALFLSIAAFSSADVALSVYESDGITPFNDRRIAVGTELKLLVSSDANDLWSGGIFLKDDARNLGFLTGYGQDPNTRDWNLSHFSMAGTEAYVFDWEDSLIQGFDLFTSPEADSSPGDWFMIDYIAIEPGEPNVAFYDYSVSWDEPNEFVYLRQVPAADFNADGIVNLKDYSLLCSYWLTEDCSEPNCVKADLDGDEIVDVNDLMLFTDDWMWGAEISSDPNQNQPEQDPNLIYRIVDVNGLSDISLAVGKSITLYVDMQSIDDNGVWAFDIEVNISDPNLGSIDNTPYDPNDPPGTGTARILADPNRWTLFDRWGPGYQQNEGIYMSGVGYDAAFDEGHLASFVYTCQGTGDVILNLISRDSTGSTGEILYPTLNNITIHQGEGDSMAMSSMTMSSMDAEKTTTPLSPEDMVQFLEEIWIADPDIQDTIDKKVWKEFIKSVEESNQ